jgi:N-acetylmuramoyl-L-alanine amidase
MRSRFKIAVIVLMIGLSYITLTQSMLSNHLVTETFSKATLKYGAVGQDVRELQGRLKFLGYYKGEIDGDFGTSTLTSLKSFQRSFGMNSDGVAGAKTKLKLYEATKKWKPGTNENQTVKQSTVTNQNKLQTSSHRGFSSQDLKMMANAVYGEARGEPYIGQVAVAAVILNRVDHPSFPSTPSGVIFQPGAFTAVADGQIWLTPNQNAVKAVQDALNGWDPSDGCIYYFNPVTATSKWIWSRPQYKKIGKHVFCR